MNNEMTWGHPDPDDMDYGETPAGRAFLKIPEIWDAENDPHPNTKLANAFMNFGNKYINSDPAGGISISASPATYNTEKEVTQNSTYTPPSQQANNQGLLANITKPATQPIKDFSIKAATPAKPVSYQPQTSPKPDSAFTKAQNSISQGDIAAGAATNDLMSATGGQYLKRGIHNTHEQPSRAEAAFTADLLRETAQGIGNMMMNAGSDRAAHDSDTGFNLHFSQDLADYREHIGKTLNDSGNAWLQNHDLEHRTNMERNARNGQIARNELRTRAAHTTSQAALAFNGLLTIGEDKIPTAVELAHEIRKNRLEWEDAKSEMMTPREIRTDTAEHYASDMENYLSQTLVGEHFVNLAKVRAYRGAPFMMSNAVDMIDKSFDAWADNIIEKGDHSYLNALRDTIIQDHPDTNDVLISLIAKFMGGINGDALTFFWNSLKETEKHKMMKDVKQRQKAKLGSTDNTHITP